MSGWSLRIEKYRRNHSSCKNSLPSGVSCQVQYSVFKFKLRLTSFQVQHSRIRCRGGGILRSFFPRLFLARTGPNNCVHDPSTKQTHSIVFFFILPGANCTRMSLYALFPTHPTVLSAWSLFTGRINLMYGPALSFTWSKHSPVQYITTQREEMARLAPCYSSTCLDTTSTSWPYDVPSVNYIFRLVSIDHAASLRGFYPPRCGNNLCRVISIIICLFLSSLGGGY